MNNVILVILWFFLSLYLLKLVTIIKRQHIEINILKLIYQANLTLITDTFIYFRSRKIRTLDFYNFVSKASFVFLGLLIVENSLLFKEDKNKAILLFLGFIMSYLLIYMTEVRRFNFKSYIEIKMMAIFLIVIMAICDSMELNHFLIANIYNVIFFGYSSYLCLNYLFDNIKNNNLLNNIFVLCITLFFAKLYIFPLLKNENQVMVCCLLLPTLLTIYLDTRKLRILKSNALNLKNRLMKHELVISIAIIVGRFVLWILQ